MLHQRPSPKERVPGAPYAVDDIVWKGGSSLVVVPNGVHYSVILDWRSPGWKLRVWYIYLQDPLTRTPIGFDYLDQFLDLVIEPDLSSWRWKDEDELAEALAAVLGP